MRTIPLILSALLAAAPVAAINDEYARQLERSGCTQATELQGCDITKTKEENARAGFGAAPAADAAAPATFKDLAGKDAIGAIDTMAERGFADVDSFESGDTRYGIFYKRDTRQCIQLTFADNIVQSADDIRTHPKCR